MANCPICERDAISMYEVYDDRYGYPGRFQLMRCAACGHGFLQGAGFTDAQVQTLYSSYYPRRSMRPEEFRPETTRAGFGAWLDGAKASAFRWVPSGAKVLDIGCGFGQALGYHKGRGCEVWGVESDENVRRVAELQGFKIRIGVFKPDDFPRDYFDVVTLDQVIEHAMDPVAMLAGVRQVLKPDGSAILSTPNVRGWGAMAFGRRWINWHAPYHQHFFSRRSMQLAARKAHLEARPLGTVTSSEWLYYQWIHLATRPKPGEQSRFWAGAGAFGASERAALKLASLLHRTRIDHLVTRLFDALGMGDSQLFDLRRA